MSRRHFGTDGVRGIANQGLTPELALQIGSSLAESCAALGYPKRTALVRDTRDSGPMLAAALTAGFLAAGWNVSDLGVLPTPAASFMTRFHGFGLGAVISASHNPAEYNGIKFFGPDGKKIPDELEEKAESLFDGPFSARPRGSGLGSLNVDGDMVELYLHHLAGLAPGGLTGMKLALDCAHGAASSPAAEVFGRLGAEIFLTGANPDGKNINAEGGATKPKVIQDFTVTSGAEIGAAFDGDADRVVFSDEQGRLINGDRYLAAYVWDLAKKGQTPRAVVGTVMSNGGLKRFLEEMGVELILAPVGDKYVQQEIEKSGAPIGGEQSGHIILPHIGPTGDGIANAVLFIQIMKKNGVSASFLHDLYKSWPQVLFNLRVNNAKGWSQNERAAQAVEAAQAKLGIAGRVNVRPSGTQPVLRLMVESDSQDLRDAVADEILTVFQDELDAETEGKVDLTHALGD